MELHSRNDEQKDRAVNGAKGGASFTMHGNFKVFARAIFALNRIGDELYLEPNQEGLALRSLNCSKSAYAAFLFSTTFFASCDVEKIKDDQYNLCRISMKSALMAFKCAKSSEKAVLSCRLYINPRADTMIVQLTHTYDSDKIMKTEVKVPISEFERYSVPKDTSITVNLKELKAFIVFAEHYQQLVNLYFEEPGSPVVIALENDINFTAELVVATVDYDYSVIEPDLERLPPQESESSKNQKRTLLSSSEKPQISNSGGVLSGISEQFLHPAASQFRRPGQADTASLGTSAKKQCLRTQGDAPEDGFLGGPSTAETRVAESPMETDREVLPESPPPPPRNQKFRQFFLSSSQRTLDASQLFVDKTIIAPDSDNDE